jgi:hypothetical protein
VRKEKPEDPVCSTCGHAVSGRCDIHGCERNSTHTTIGCTYWQSKGAITESKCEGCSGFEFTSPSLTWGRCKHKFTRNGIHKEWFICNLYQRKEDKELANKFYCKCGKEFKKSSTASVTGYTIDMDKSENEHCQSCSFRLEVKKGYPVEVFDRWECSAGSKEPNQNNDWSGRLDDKTTLHIKSLQVDFLDAVKDYLIQNEGHGIAGWGFNADLEDCRRQISIAIESNKKGIAAKKALIERFFGKAALEREVDEDEETFISNETCGTCDYAQDCDSVNFAMCAELHKKVKKKSPACANYIPVADVIDDEPERDLEEQLDELLKDEGHEEQTYIYRGLV